MIRKFCDCCGVEVNRFYSFNYLCHIADSTPSYVQIDSLGNMQGVSGREDVKELCLTCYNRVYRAAYDKFQTISLPVETMEAINDARQGINLKPLNTNKFGSGAK